MRRLVVLLSLVALLAVATLRSVPPGAPAQPAISYAPGWNLVAGPDGSHVVGAVGVLYTLQPGDSGYRTLPIESALRACWGYWAYFPQGGSLDVPAGTGSPGCAVTLPPGQWVLAGNPSGDQSALVAGGDAVLRYDPTQGYQPVSTLSPGQGAWVLSAAGGQLSVSPEASAPDLTAFKALARQASCAQTRNQLFLIDGQQVFWVRTGACADASYAYQLFDGTPDRLLCALSDSIAGPQRRCQVGYDALFDTMVGHLDAPDLGLGPTHTVQPIRLS